MTTLRNTALLALTRVDPSLLELVVRTLGNLLAA